LIISLIPGKAIYSYFISPKLQPNFDRCRPGKWQMKAMPRKARQTRKIARLCSEFVCVTIKLDAEGAQAESKRGRKVKGEWGMGNGESRKATPRQPSQGKRQGRWRRNRKNSIEGMQQTNSISQTGGVDSEGSWRGGYER